MKALATLERTLPCKWSSMKSKKKTTKTTNKVGRFSPVHQPHPRLHCCQFTDLQAVSSSAGHPLPHPYAQTENQQLWPLFLERWLGSGFKGTGGNWRWVLDV